MKALSILSIAVLSFGFTGCNDTKVEKAIEYLYQTAPEGRDNAVTGYRIVTIKNVGKYSVHFTNLYKEEGAIHADTFLLEGMFTRYEGAPLNLEVE